MCDGYTHHCLLTIQTISLHAKFALLTELCCMQLFLSYNPIFWRYQHYLYRRRLSTPFFLSHSSRVGQRSVHFCCNISAFLSPTGRSDSTCSMILRAVRTAPGAIKSLVMARVGMLRMSVRNRRWSRTCDGSLVVFRDKGLGIRIWDLRGALRAPAVFLRDLMGFISGQRS